MPRTSLVFVCRECGGESIRWAGQCPHCRAWNTLEEFQAVPSGREERRSLRPPGAAGAPRVALAWPELNRVLGGGVVPGSLVLVGGEPGVGKSTLLMHLAGQSAEAL